MDLQLTGKRALVTGASKGIGRATALRLAQEGCDVVLVARTRETLADAAGAIRSACQVGVEMLPADLSRQAEIERVAAAAGEIDILVNNAGAIPAGDLLALDNDAFRAAWDLKVFGYISMCRAFWPGLKARSGVVVNVIGAAAEWLDPGYICGSTGNAALAAFTRALGKQAQKEGMRVVGIHPGPTATDRFAIRFKARAAQELGDENRWRDLTGSLPYGRPAEPEEVAAAVAFLASPLSGYTTGSILTMDGAIRQ
jgi:NAD(P)-dependent dehydrogenase (short-subunit alcohol dehydrogenase family)